MDLPYEDKRFDLASISFGIRNVDDPVKALREMGRVVKPGGKVVVLEFGQPKGLMKFSPIYRNTLSINTIDVGNLTLVFHLYCTT